MKTSRPSTETSSADERTLTSASAASLFGLKASFADGASALIPWRLIKEITGAAEVKRIFLKNPREAIVVSIEGDETALPWDFIRMYADAKFGSRMEYADERDRRLFGERLRNRRIEAGLSQSDLAKDAGANENELSEIEAGEKRPNLAFIRRMAKALQCPVYALLTAEEEDDGEV